MIILTLQQLLYIKKISDCRSINKASQILHISQPALTKQLQLLENELGVLLFTRNKHGMELTKDGEDFVSQAKILLKEANCLQQKYTFANSKNKVLNIGALPSISTYVLPKITRKLKSKGFEINVTILNTSAEIENLFDERKIHAGFIQNTDKNISAHFVLEEPYYVIMHDSHRLAKEKYIKLEQLADQKIILPSNPCDIRDSISGFFKNNNIPLDNYMEFSQNEPIIPFVLATSGLTILPQMLVENNIEGLTCIPFSDSSFKREIYLLSYIDDIIDAVVYDVTYI